MKNSLFAAIFSCTIGCMAQDNMVVQPALSVLSGFDKVRDLAMDGAGIEAYFTVQSQTEEISVIATSSKTNGIWDTPAIAPFSGKYQDMEPFLSPDGLRLYFVSNRPLHDSILNAKDFDIWYVERVSPTKEWSDPVNMGFPINTEHNEFYPAVALNGNLYYTTDRPESKGKDDIFFSPYTDNGYSEPVSLDANVNSEGYEYNAYISKDDSYLIFGGYGREDGQGSGDLYISFKNDKGEWSRAKPLPAPINSTYMDYCPFMDEDNGVLYFTSRRSATPEKGFETMEQLVQFLDSHENGNSRLYRTAINMAQLKE